MTKQPLNTPPASLEKLSRLMDSSIRLPGGYRIGWDGIIGLIPGIGDLTGLAISLYILVGARRAGASSATLFKMMVNVTLESVLGAIPVVGDIFDFVYKANNRNMGLLRQQMADPESTSTQSQQHLWMFGVAMLLLFMLVVYLLVKILSATINLLF